MPTHQPDDTSIISENNDDQIFLPKKKRLDPRLVLSGVMMFILVSSSGLALVAQNRDTDNRSSASEGELSATAITEPCVTTPGNLVKNPSFEGGMTGWNKGRNLGTSILKTGAPHCKKMLKATFLINSANVDAFTQSFSRPITITPNDWYRITFWTKTNSTNPDYTGSVFVTVMEDLPAKQGPATRLYIPQQIYPTREWQKIDLTVKSEAEFSTLKSRLYVMFEGGTKGSSILMDNITITKIQAPTPTMEPFPTPPFNPSPTASQSAQKRVFVTSTTYDGNLGGTDGADAKCQASAEAAGLGGQWIAWLSTQQNDVRDRLDKNSNGYALLDGTSIADVWNYASTSKIDHPININEYGNIVSDLPHEMEVWTNTAAWGSHVTTGEISCNSFTTNSSEMKGIGGSIGLTWEWTGVFGETCNVANHLYCFEQ
jgi:hypothetical protein